MMNLGVVDAGMDAKALLGADTSISLPGKIAS